MKKTLLTAALLMAIGTATSAKNQVETVERVIGSRILLTPIDLVITNVDNALSSTLEIANNDAAIIFENVNPSTVISKYLPYIRIKGALAGNGLNCRVAIYRHGSIILPHGSTFPALTVYTGNDFTGDSKVITAGARQVMTGTWDNSIRSIKLKRGFMATLANHADGTGYSHCYIADREDIEINLPKEQAGRTTMIRVFKWNWPSKKGCSDARDENMMNTCKATWYYDWGAGRSSRVNHEYVPQRHHEAGNSNSQGWKGAWESWDNINASDETCTHVLGQNEPDNTSGAGEVYTYVTQIPTYPRENCATSTLADHAKEFLYSGKRIGTFACCNPNSGWVTEYVNYCRENNIRIDFVATHYYIGGQSPQGCIDRLWALYNATKLPVWVTEWNNGANWSGESGFSTDAGWYQWGSGNDNQKNGEWLRDVLRRADRPENTKWLERLAVYNAVEGRREIFTNGQITAGGKVWGAYESGFAYDSEAGSINYFMPWKHHAPYDLSTTLNQRNNSVTLKWTNPNTDMTDYAAIEEKQGSKWVEIARMPMNDNEHMSYSLDISDHEPAMYEVRVVNHEYDNSTHTSNIATFTISAAHSVGLLQYGQLKIGDTEAVSTDLEPYDAEPYVFSGLVSQKNSSNGISNQVVTINKNNFKFRFFPWQLPAPVDYKLAENTDYMVFPSDTIIHLTPDMMIMSQTAGKVKGTEVRVTFPEAFPVGVIPVVIPQQVSSSSIYPPVVVKIWDVTNEGFSLKLMRQETIPGIFNQQTVNYIAVSPGQASVGGGMLLTAGIDRATPIYGAANKKMTFSSPSGEEYGLDSPIIIAAPQTHNYPVLSVFRMSPQSSTDLNEQGLVKSRNVKRQIDPVTTVTDKNVVETGDYMGYVCLSRDPNGSADDAPIITGVSDAVATSGKGFSVYAHDGKIYCNDKTVNIYNAAGQSVQTGKRVPAGIYVASKKGKIVKFVVK